MIDIHGYAKRLEQVLARIKKSQVMSTSDKDLLKR